MDVDMLLHAAPPPFGLATPLCWDGLMQTMFENYAESEFPDSIKMLYSKLRRIEEAKTLGKVRKFLTSFTEEEINYLNSKFLDELYSVFITKRESLYFHLSTARMCEFLLRKNLNVIQNTIEAAEQGNFLCVKVTLETMLFIPSLQTLLLDSVKIKLFKILYIRKCPTETLDLLLRISSVNVRNKCLVFLASICGDTDINLIKIILGYGISEKPLAYRSALCYSVIDEYFKSRQI